jgi:hypothetical protein
MRPSEDMRFLFNSTYFSHIWIYAYILNIRHSIRTTAACEYFSVKMTALKEQLNVLHYNTFDLYQREGSSSDESTHVIYVKWFYFEVKWSEVNWNEVSYGEVLGNKVLCTLERTYIEDTWLYCDCFIRVYLVLLYFLTVL